MVATLDTVACTFSSAAVALPSGVSRETPTVATKFVTVVDTVLEFVAAAISTAVAALFIVAVLVPLDKSKSRVTTTSAVEVLAESRRKCPSAREPGGTRREWRRRRETRSCTKHESVPGQAASCDCTRMDSSVDALVRSALGSTAIVTSSAC